MSILNIVLALSSISFLFYGINCLFSREMKEEFTRFGLENQRVLTGYFQLFGALGLGIGYFFFPLLTFISSVGLTILMFSGFTVRIKIKDSISQSLPSLIFALLNLFISIKYYYLLF